MITEFTRLRNLLLAKNESLSFQLFLLSYSSFSRYNDTFFPYYP